MGLEHHALTLVKLIAAERALGATATFGRQSLDLPPAVLAAEGVAGEPFAEPLLRRYGATAAESFDVSPYEGATHVADFNRPVAVPRRYDTVLDFGTSEHVFDQAQVFANLRALAAPGGLVGQILPVNNLAGHGFWQYSGDLFHALYAPANGFDRVELWYASTFDRHHWHVAPPPRRGARSDIASVEPVVAIVLARRDASAGDAPLVLQQDYYAEAWEAGAGDGGAGDAPAQMNPPPSRVRRLVGALRRAAPGAYRVTRNSAHVAALAVGRNPLGLDGNAALTRVRTDALVAGRRDQLPSIAARIARP